MRVFILKLFVDASGYDQLMRIFNIVQRILLFLKNQEAPEYTLADGTYTVTSDVLKANEDVQSMAAQAVKSATVTYKKWNFY